MRPEQFIDATRPFVFRARRLDVVHLCMNAMFLANKGESVEVIADNKRIAKAVAAFFAPSFTDRIPVTVKGKP